MIKDSFRKNRRFIRVDLMIYGKNSSERRVVACFVDETRNTDDATIHDSLHEISPLRLFLRSDFAFPWWQSRREPTVSVIDALCVLLVSRQPRPAIISNGKAGLMSVINTLRNTPLPPFRLLRSFDIA